MYSDGTSAVNASVERVFSFIWPPRGHISFSAPPLDSAPSERREVDVNQPGGAWVEIDRSVDDTPLRNLHRMSRVRQIKVRRQWDNRNTISVTFRRLYLYEANLGDFMFCHWKHLKST